MLLWDERADKVKLSKCFPFCKVVFVAAYVEEQQAGNLNSFVDACQVLTTKSIPCFSSVSLFRFLFKFFVCLVLSMLRNSSQR